MFFDLFVYMSAERLLKCRCRDFSCNSWKSIMVINRIKSTDSVLSESRGNAWLYRGYSSFIWFNTGQLLPDLWKFAVFQCFSAFCIAILYQRDAGPVNERWRQRWVIRSFWSTIRFQQAIGQCTRSQHSVYLAACTASGQKRRSTSPILSIVIHFARPNAYQVSVQLPTYADNVALPAFARRTLLLQQSIDISCPPGPQQQTCSIDFIAAGPHWDKRSDGQTDGRKPTVS